MMKELDPPADEAVDILYPERPQPPLPPTLNITELEGISYQGMDGLRYGKNLTLVDQVRKFLSQTATT
ncbi:hypothetical protein FOXG_15852 [Fusarium oxysporum f. sp. lycopersici 4287]|uniref:Uncharacterized protein n=3 Tax=Fusarium oxysporum TaxID=5507 RepID=A0A0J9WUR4_FUSO4|nr:hypothetical protein FOXG_15852 [Fusarium oxysporum f. sp. lycopersici 4287]EXK25811.1 hypothetical protein FOMG_17544 [Fusarium oxysporum f. sp. melonis 26406]KNB18237.1 hypothetical protein FOXG_15852 [Fusarium oxysporum f. sp. lycopersici 4287]